MSARSNAAPMIIKRKKVIAGGGHHGGAWKVAYADFVTAMMAFFLLMWLLNATTEKQRKGLADYFSPTVPISRVSGGGNGHFGGETVYAEDTLPKNGTGATREHVTEASVSRGETGLRKMSPGEAEEIRRKLDEALEGMAGESMVSRDLMRHIITRVTDEGLVVELFDLDGAYLFEPLTDEPTDLMNALLEIVTRLSALVENDMALAAHTRAEAGPLRENPVWNLSTARAHRSRLLMESAGADPSRIRRVTGHADRSPVTRDPMAVRNNRIEVTFLRS
ncbi:chemotaxis protein MotB [Roseovarius sp. SCSIO 43702]|uniref:flagellar motor protein MotB n=1 Tax=Roseovarius sp. SCSIO 43702 TaxID=2823043 RepID=UPI001C733E40|nr:flagellar motor protein MotB [Roseovarius sp. SCSIO 43702]QYX57075.1 chemotaxis protein MotB [Roseovarius sp. SCSIO 43702]